MSETQTDKKPAGANNKPHLDIDATEMLHVACERALITLTCRMYNSRDSAMCLNGVFKGI